MNGIMRARTIGQRLLSQLRQQRDQAALSRSDGPGDLDALLQRWPETPARVAAEMRERYGEPDETTTERLVWHHNRPWKRTMVWRDEIPHQYPVAHADCLAQSVAYAVPAEKFSDLARFNGSVVADRTLGELTAHCDDEAMNILALNLAHEIIVGAKTVDEARELHAEEVVAHAVNPPSSYTERLLFGAPAGDPADFDAPVMDDPPQRWVGERMADLADAGAR